jgi:hypothetical protein
MKITAKEARELSGPTLEERVDDVYNLIREAAAKKQRQVNLHEDFWTRGGYDRSPDWKIAVAMLQDEGFNVNFYYEERQFVDMYTIVSW